MRVQYRHSRVNQGKRQIRLIRFEKSTQVGRIRLHICKFSLNGHDVPPYKALSYTWGSDYSPVKISINHRAFQVYRNLYDFLCSYQKRTYDHEVREHYLWIDQLCIDQKNETEKGWQVQMMADIYRRATEVIIWLGPANDFTDRAVWLLDLIRDDWTILRRGQPLFRGHFLSGSMLRAYKDLLRRAKRKRELHDDFHWWEEQVELHGKTKTALWTFLSNVYWSRLWIVQEIMLACTFYVWWGEYTVDEDSLRGLERKISVTYKDPILTPWLNLSVVFDSGLARHVPLGYEAPSAVDIRFSRLIRHFGSAGCQKPQDKVFGFVAITKVGSSVAVDYKKPVEEVYLDAVRALGQEVLMYSLDVGKEPVDQDWTGLVESSYRLGLGMLPSVFKRLPPNVAQDLDVAQRCLSIDRELLMEVLPQRERGLYVAEQLAVLVRRS